MTPYVRTRYWPDHWGQRFQAGVISTQRAGGAAGRSGVRSGERTQDARDIDAEARWGSRRPHAGRRTSLLSTGSMSSPARRGNHDRPDARPTAVSAGGVTQHGVTITNASGHTLVELAFPDRSRSRAERRRTCGRGRARRRRRRLSCHHARPSRRSTARSGTSCQAKPEAHLTLVFGVGAQGAHGILSSSKSPRPAATSARTRTTNRRPCRPTPRSATATSGDVQAPRHRKDRCFRSSALTAVPAPSAERAARAGQCEWERGRR